MKQMLVIFCLFFGSLQTVNAISIVSDSAVIKDVESNQIIYSKNEQVLKMPASLTKMMSALVSVELLDLDAKIVIDHTKLSEIIGINASVANFVNEDEINVKDMIVTLMFQSAADAALYLEAYLYETKDLYFIEEMNKKAKELGMQDTMFKNSHGLDVIGQETTTADMLILLEVIATHEVLGNLLKEDEIHVQGKYYTYSFKNKLKDSDTIILGKTGFTYGAGYCLATLSSYEGRMYYTVVMDADPYVENYLTSRNDTIEMMKYASDNYYDFQVKGMNEIEEIEIRNGKKKTLQVRMEDDVKVWIEKGTENDVSYEIVIDKRNAPFQEQEIIGQLRVYVGDNLREEVSIYSVEDLEESVFSKVQYFIVENNMVIIGILLVIVGSGFVVRRKRRRY